jgi:hypothetical protein
LPLPSEMIACVSTAIRLVPACGEAPTSAWKARTGKGAAA